MLPFHGSICEHLTQFHGAATKQHNRLNIKSKQLVNKREIHACWDYLTNVPI
jgi:hypothetical protein